MGRALEASYPKTYDPKGKDWLGGAWGGGEGQEVQMGCQGEREESDLKRGEG